MFVMVQKASIFTSNTIKCVSAAGGETDWSLILEAFSDLPPVWLAFGQV